MTWLMYMSIQMFCKNFEFMITIKENKVLLIIVNLQYMNCAYINEKRSS